MCRELSFLSLSLWWWSLLSFAGGGGSRGKQLCYEKEIRLEYIDAQRLGAGVYIDQSRLDIR